MSKHGVSADDVAAALIEERPGLDQMQLHKLLYLVQAAALAWFHQPAFDDRIEAWQYGPVVRGVAGRYKDFGRTPIQQSISGDPTRLNRRLRWTVTEVATRYGRLTGVDLARLVKAPQAPWCQVRADLPDDAASNREIPHEMIEEYHGRHGLAPETLTEPQAELARQFLEGDSEALAHLIEAATGTRALIE